MSETDSSDVKPIPHDTMVAVRNYTRFHILAELNFAFVRSGMTVDQLAKRLGWTSRQVRRFLGGQTKLPIDKIGATAFAIDGSFVKFSVRETSSREDQRSQFAWYAAATLDSNSTASAPK